MPIYDIRCWRSGTATERTAPVIGSLQEHEVYQSDHPTADRWGMPGLRMLPAILLHKTVRRLLRSTLVMCGSARWPAHVLTSSHTLQSRPFWAANETWRGHDLFLPDSIPQIGHCPGPACSTSGCIG